MSKHSERRIFLFLLGLFGLLVSGLAGALEHFPSLQFLCTAACKETGELVILQVPVWVWGALFWTVVSFSALLRADWLPYLAAPALGVELALIWLMLLMKAPCVFCIANAFVVLLLAGFSFRKQLVWQQAVFALLLLIASTNWIPYENRLFASTAMPGPTSEPGVLAKVGDDVITDHRLEVLLGSKLFELKKDIYRMKKEKLDQVLVESLIQKEARERGLTVEQLIDEAVPAAKFSASDQEIDKYLQENSERLKDWHGSTPELRSRVKLFLEQQKRSQGLNTYARTLDQKYGVEILLPAPQPPIVAVGTENAPSLGPADAPVTIVEFSDYECPACRATHDTVKKLRATYGNKVRWIFMDYPLRRHKFAFKAAEAAHCAAEQGKFWEYQELVFARDRLDLEHLINYGAEIGIPADAFRKCLQDEKHKATIEKSTRDATFAGIDRTPSFIINGVLLTGGASYDTFVTRIDEELKKAAAMDEAAKKEARKP
ncbi:MAG: thioredoxin domain-containing protein [Syntrophobacter sp.]